MIVALIIKEYGRAGFLPKLRFSYGWLLIMLS
jgi:hypothetical protein